MIIVDSGLGGISVVRALRATGYTAPLTYCADTQAFPYGKRTAEEIAIRATALLTALLNTCGPQPIVLACNTLSTLCLELLRTQFSVPLIGTVPAIKTAATQSVSRRFTLLATPNTAGSAYTQKLILEFASQCVVDVYGAPNLAAMAERMLLGEPIEDAALRTEMKPAFCDDALGKTDSIVLGCTHYPLIRDALIRTAPWPVQWIDSSDAIARRALSFTDTPPAQSGAFVTSAAHVVAYEALFQREGFADTRLLNVETAVVG